MKAAVGTAEPAQEVEGYYTYTAPDGTPVKVEYISNEFGFQPRGEKELKHVLQKKIDS